MAISTTQFRQLAQHPSLPWEVTDIVIDYLHNDVHTLGICSSVCSEWLPRSRHHIFSTVQLWPWRVREFVRLADEKECTFTGIIKRIEIDDSRERSARKHWDGRSRSLSPIGKRSGINLERKREKDVMFTDAMAYSDLKCLTQVTAIQVRNVDWTLLTPTRRNSLRSQLSRFTQLRRLEFHDVVFQDMREVARIVNSFPSLHHLTANLSFMQYLEQGLASTPKIDFSTSMRSIELGTDEGIPVVLSCIGSAQKSHPILEMHLKNIQKNQLQYIQSTLRGISGTRLQNLSLHFKREKVFTTIFGDDVESALDFSTQNDLRTVSIGGLQLAPNSIHGHSQVVERVLPRILGRIEASFLKNLELQFHIEDTPGAVPNPYSEDELARSQSLDVDWSHLQSTLLGLHFFGLSAVCVRCTLGAESAWGEDRVEQQIRAGMVDLDARGVLSVLVARERRVVEDDQMYDDDEIELSTGDKPW